MLLKRYLFPEGVVSSANCGNLFESSPCLRLPARCEITSRKFQSGVDNHGTNGSAIDTLALFLLPTFLCKRICICRRKREFFKEDRYKRKRNNLGNVGFAEVVDWKVSEVLCGLMRSNLYSGGNSI